MVSVTNMLLLITGRIDSSPSLRFLDCAIILHDHGVWIIIRNINTEINRCTLPAGAVKDCFAELILNNSFICFPVVGSI